MRVLANKALERTRRVGVPASRAVVGVPPCRSTPCWTERGTERLRIRGSEIRGSSRRIVAATDETAQHEPRSRRGLSTWSRRSGSLLDRLPGMAGEASTISSQSAFLSLGRFVKTAGRRSPVGTPRP